MPENEKKESFKVVDKRKIAVPDIESEAKTDKTIDAEDKTSSEKIIKEQKPESNSGMTNFEADFSTFIYSLNTQALLFLGKIPNPISKKYEKDIGTAKYLIDTIDMLSKKTKGNLDENETKLIENILYDLRMAYISEKK